MAVGDEGKERESRILAAAVRLPSWQPPRPVPYFDISISLPFFSSWLSREKKGGAGDVEFRRVALSPSADERLPRASVFWLTFSPLLHPAKKERNKTERENTCD